MRETLNVVRLGHSLVSNSSLNVAQLDAVVPGAGGSEPREQHALILLLMYLNFFSSLDCRAAVRDAASCTPLNRRCSDRSSTDARCRHQMRRTRTE